MAKGQREVGKRNDTGFVYVQHECPLGLLMIQTYKLRNVP
ncbi:MAG: hypothetical protein SRB1_00238 [Desulfobacteraceae bacterium Eth-SRB1]|nr:MAG: hypothetical protein SRB1_00238 [Desulfobacteraceae bacterium Eth-SRB1]